MHVHCPNNAGRGAQTDLTLLCSCFGDHETKVKEVGSCWLKSLTGFKLCATNNTQRGVQTDTTCNIQQCCVRLHRALKKKISTLGFLK